RSSKFVASLPSTSQIIRSDRFAVSNLRSRTCNDSRLSAEETQQREQQMSDASSHGHPAHDVGWRPATYYPDPAIHALDPRFEKYWLKLSAVERIATGLRWAEGP